MGLEPALHTASAAALSINPGSGCLPHGPNMLRGS